MNLENTKSQIINFIKTQAGDKPVILGLSGGIDSALTAYLAVKALGNKKVHCLIMPSDTNTEQDLKLAKLITKNLNLQYSVFSLDPILNSYQKILKSKPSKTTLGNLKARIRMSLLYAKANELNGLVLGTGNKSEISIGYFTKYGDGGADLLPIADLYKTKVRELAKYLNISQEIIDRPPTAGLWTGQTDEADIGVAYEVLDQILEAIGKKKSLKKFVKKDVIRIKMMTRDSAHKRTSPPVCEFNDSSPLERGRQRGLI